MSQEGNNLGSNDGYGRVLHAMLRFSVRDDKNIDLLAGWFIFMLILELWDSAILHDYLKLQ